MAAKTESGLCSWCEKHHPESGYVRWVKAREATVDKTTENALEALSEMANEAQIEGDYFG